MGSFAFLVYQLAPENPAASRSYPFNGLVTEYGGRQLALSEEEYVDAE